MPAESSWNLQVTHTSENWLLATNWGISMTPLMFSNFVEQLELRKVLYLRLQFYYKDDRGIGLGGSAVSMASL